MLRPNVGDGFLIFKKDLENGIAKKDTYKGMLEFHIFRHRELKNSLIYLPNSTKELLELDNPLYLFAIIVTKDDNAHILDRGDRIFVKGLKFDNQLFDGKKSEDLDNYLRKTGRK